MPLWGSITWIIARAGGFVAYGLLTVAIVEGLALSLRWQSPQRWPRLIHNEMHQFLVVVAFVFSVIHGLAVWIDPFTRFRWFEVMVPLTSHYRPLWTALGIVAGYLGLAIALSVYLRPRLGYAWWRKLHYLTYLVFVLATLHGLGTGSDSRAAWGEAIYGGSVGLVLSLTLIRLVKPSGRQPAGRWGWAALASAMSVLGVLWALKGPLQPGWNALANNGHGSGARVSVVPLEQSPPRLPLSDNFEGAVSLVGPDQRGIYSIQCRTQLTGHQGAVLDLVLSGMASENGTLLLTGGRVLFENPARSVYLGTITGFTAQSVKALLRPPGGRTQTVLSVVIRFSQINLPSGTVAGHVVISSG